MRNIVANAISALVAAAVATATVGLVTYLEAEPDLRVHVLNSLTLIGLASFMLAFASLLPIAMFLQASRRFSLRSSAISGIGVGAIPSLVSLLLGGWSHALIELFLLCAGAGGLSATAYYLAFQRLGPNNSFKPNPLRGSA
jgi:hypothetical protein